MPIILLDRDGRRLLDARADIELPVTKFVIGMDFNGALDDSQSFFYSQFVREMITMKHSQLQLDIVRSAILL